MLVWFDSIEVRGEWFRWVWVMMIFEIFWFVFKVVKIVFRW